MHLAVTATHMSAILVLLFVQKHSRAHALEAVEGVSDAGSSDHFGNRIAAETSHAWRELLGV